MGWALTRDEDFCVVTAAESLPRSRRSAGRPRPAARAGPASRAHVVRVERRGEFARAQGLLPGRGARDALGGALLGDAELRASQSGASRLRRALDRLAVEQRTGISAPDGPGRSEAHLAGLSALRLRQRLG